MRNFLETTLFHRRIESTFEVWTREEELRIYLQNSPGILKTKSAQISQEKPLRKKYPKITYHLQNPKKEENMQYVWHDHLEQLGKTQKQV